ncbi:MAG: RtcB family protein [Nitrospira sp. CG24C]|jgi:tRNA-splicing ligase RtcB|nr:MAG: RtcB family protein [Nitrospira sp. CG24C]
MKTKQDVIMRQWLAEPLPKSVEQALERLGRTEDVCRIAVMPDVHLADDVCIGTVMATTHMIYPDAVGGDIGCGMAAVRFDTEAALLSDEWTAAKVLHGLIRTIPSIRHGAATAVYRLPEHLRDVPLSDQCLEKLKQRDARVQLGTLGRGNHFLEFQVDEEGALWLMVHSGSRMIGQAIRDHHLRAATRSSTGFWYLESDKQSGEAYLRDVIWALQYAEENRQAMIRSAVCLMEDLFSVTADWSSVFSCHHNHVRREIHCGSQWWVHRKGAIWAGAGVKGIIPGSMGTASYHVEGRGHEGSLQSSSHGAGRLLSRRDAHRIIRIDQLKREMKGVWFDQRRLSRLCDEAPSAYKDIACVMRAQSELTKILRIVRPVLNYKAMS